MNKSVGLIDVDIEKGARFKGVGRWELDQLWSWWSGLCVDLTKLVKMCC